MFGFKKKENKSIEQEIEQLQSDDDYVKGLALENKKLIEGNSEIIMQLLEVSELAQTTRTGMIGALTIQAEEITSLKKKVEDMERALTILLK